MPHAEGDTDKRGRNRCVQQMSYHNGTRASPGQASGKCHQFSQGRWPCPAGGLGGLTLAGGRRGQGDSIIDYKPGHSCRSVRGEFVEP